MTTVTLQPGKERPVVQRHPWVFSGAIARIQGRQPERGAVVDVRSADGEWLARGCWSAGSQIRVRLFTWNPDEPIDDALIRRRIERAIDGRRRLVHLQKTFSDVVKTDKTGLSKTAHTRWMISAFANFLPGSTIFRLA